MVKLYTTNWGSASRCSPSKSCRNTYRIQRQEFYSLSRWYNSESGLAEKRELRIVLALRQRVLCAVYQRLKHAFYHQPRLHPNLQTHTKMLFLRAPYGEEKLFALITPAGGSWAGKTSESSATNFGLHAAAGADVPRKAQATGNRASEESAARKSNDNGVCQPNPTRLDNHAIPGAQKGQDDSTTRHASNGSL